MASEYSSSAWISFRVLGQTARLLKQAANVPIYLPGAVLTAAKEWTFQARHAPGNTHRKRLHRCLSNPTARAMRRFWLHKFFCAGEDECVFDSLHDNS
jgi:hypothetical protein